MPDAQFHRLPDLGVVALRGPEALTFLQGQVTADLLLPQSEQGALAAWCTPQGRVIALLHVLRQDDALLCVLPRELAAGVAQRLARFVMRAKVTLSDESGALAVAGVTGEEPGAPGTGDGFAALPLAAGRRLLAGPTSRLESLAGAFAEARAGAWEAAAIRLGEPEVYAATSEAWVPQMLNLDLLGAVSFRKGCYPGQEIVARTQNLGRIKRRLLRYRIEGRPLPAPGDALWLGRDKAGEAVRVASCGERAELLAVVSLEAAGAALTDAGAAVQCLPEPLPYDVPEAPQRP